RMEARPRRGDGAGARSFCEDAKWRRPGSMSDWDDLRFFLAAARAGTLSAAATALGVEPSTVGRRLEALEASLGTRLFRRSQRGYVLTEAGQRIRAGVEQLEEGVL